MATDLQTRSHGSLSDWQACSASQQEVEEFRGQSSEFRVSSPDETPPEAAARACRPYLPAVPWRRWEVLRARAADQVDLAPGAQRHTANQVILAAAEVGGVEESRTWRRDNQEVSRAIRNMFRSLRVEFDTPFQKNVGNRPGYESNSSSFNILAETKSLLN